MKFHHMTISSLNGSPAQHQHPRPLRPAPPTPARPPARPRPPPARRRDRRTVHRHRPGVDEHPHLEPVGRAAPPTRPPPAPPRRRAAASRPAPATSSPTASRRTPGPPPRRPGRTAAGTWCSNRGSTAGRRRRQHHPQLRPVQHRRRRRRHLRVRDAPPGGHEVDLARAHHRHRPERVAVLDLAAEQPRHGREPAVRVRRDVHPAGPRDVVGPVVVDEAPGPDERALPRRQRAPHGHRPRPTERHLPRPRAPAPTPPSLHGTHRPTTRTPRARRSGLAQSRQIGWTDVCNPRPTRRCAMGLFDRLEASSSVPSTACSPGLALRRPARRDREHHPTRHGRPRRHLLGPRHRPQRLHHRAEPDRLRAALTDHAGVENDLVAAAEEHADSQHYQPAGPIDIVFDEDDDLETGVFRIRPSKAKRPRATGLTGQQRPSPAPPDRADAGGPAPPAAPAGRRPRPGRRRARPARTSSRPRRRPARAASTPPTGRGSTSTASATRSWARSPSSAATTAPTSSSTTRASRAGTARSA